MNSKVIHDLVNDLNNNIHHPFADIRSQLVNAGLMEWNNCPLFNKPGMEVYAPSDVIVKFHTNTQSKSGTAAFKTVGYNEEKSEFIIVVLWTEEE